MNYCGVTLIQTCQACPEQYDAYKDGKKVGFLHLRNGKFTVNYPSINGKSIYSAYTMGDGTFFECEREMFLKNACLAITHYLRSEINEVSS